MLMVLADFHYQQHSNMYQSQLRLLMERPDNSLVSASQVKSYTERDIVLSNVKKYVLQGWPENISRKEITPYKQRQHELSIEDSCLLWGTRVIVPHQLRQHVLQEIHKGYPGIVRMKCFAGSHVWCLSLYKSSRGDQWSVRRDAGEGISTACKHNSTVTCDRNTAVLSNMTRKPYKVFLEKSCSWWSLST